MARCTNCGHDLPAELATAARFCPFCGSRLSLGAAEAVTSTGLIDLSDQTSFVPVVAAVADGSELRPDTALLIVSQGSNEAGRYLLAYDRSTVGRDPRSDIFLDDVTVSRKHAVISRAGHTFTVADAGSLNGTYVNRERVDAAVLHDGDVVQIGKFRAIFRAAAGTGA